MKGGGGEGTAHRKFALHSTSAGGVTNGCERSTCEFPRLVPLSTVYIFQGGYIQQGGWTLESVDFSSAIVGSFEKGPRKRGSKKERRTRAAGYHCPGQSLPR